MPPLAPYVEQRGLLCLRKVIEANAEGVRPAVTASSLNVLQRYSPQLQAFHVYRPHQPFQQVGTGKQADQAAPDKQNAKTEGGHSAAVRALYAGRPVFAVS